MSEYRLIQGVNLFSLAFQILGYVAVIHMDSKSTFFLNFTIISIGITINMPYQQSQKKGQELSCLFGLITGKQGRKHSMFIMADTLIIDKTNNRNHRNA